MSWRISIGRGEWASPDIFLPTLPSGITVLGIDSWLQRLGLEVAAARELRCSDAYIHVRLKRAGLTLAETLEAQGLEVLLHGRG